jgi:hypothetical protein
MKRKVRARWSDEEAQQFADGFRLRAARFMDKRKQTAKYLCRTPQRFPKDLSKDI